MVEMVFDGKGKTVFVQMILVKGVKSVSIYKSGRIFTSYFHYPGLNHEPIQQMAGKFL